MHSKLFYICILTSIFSIVLSDDDNPVGKCTLASQLFDVKSDKSSSETEQITKDSICPGVEQSCCDLDTYKGMNTWWTGEGQMSMNKLWFEKVKRMYQEVKMLHQVFYKDIVKYAQQYLTFREKNIQCEEVSYLVQEMDEIGVFQELFELYPKTATQCWQYTIDYLRGLSCSLCDLRVQSYYSLKSFLLDNSECYAFTHACRFHIKSFRTLLNYSQLLSSVSSCKDRNQISDAESKQYIP